MSNPATFLSDFLSLGGKKQHDRDVRPLLDAAFEIEDRLEVLGQTGFRTTPFLGLCPILRTAITNGSDQTLSKIVTYRGQGTYTDVRIAEAEGHLLDVLAERLELSGVTSEGSIQQIRELLGQVKLLVTEDNSLDIELRLFISRTILAIEKQLDDVEILGDFQLRNALITLFGLLRTAESTSTKPAKWKDAWEKWGVPITQNVIAGIPQTALGLGAIFAALPPGS